MRAALITLRTGRLTLRPVNAVNIPDLIKLKADPMVFGQMLATVLRPLTLASHRRIGRGHRRLGPFRFGMFAIHDRTAFQGMTGVQRAPKQHGLALRFAVWPDTRGRGIAREAANAALRYAHDEIGIPRIIAVARADNFASRMVLGGIGMREHDAFLRNGHIMLVYESRVSERQEKAGLF